MQQTMAWLSSIEEVVEDAKAGKMFILVDDEGRENEGDLVIPAQMANAEAVNFMAKHGRGLICLSMTQDRVEELGLHLMSQKNQALHQTAFTVSIEAREGVTTGISAADRAQTIAVAIDPKKGRRDIVTPGHIFPLVAQDGGVLVRAGHTEAAVDIARMAGLNPAGVICEIMNDDGTMARMPDLVTFAQLHGLKIATIADLIAYRRRNERLIDLVSESKINSRYGGEFRIRVYSNSVEYAEHIALIRGDISGDEPVLVRMHQANILADSLGDITPGEFYGGEARPRSGELAASMRMIAAANRGVVVFIRETAPTFISRALKEREGMSRSGPIAELRQYGLGAQILLDLGLKNVILLSNTQHNIVGLEGYGLTVVAQQPIPESLYKK
ncbi:3,4-dihydroxy-2-butanone-4-phosphate synthase [Terripilifer ovatus]|uniref:3,4-dihydroxy-2-butanone-4-phosphate synthase n=1 Tax=Terripilifer ovatus TaxID=3032367 RepID=UPI003AB97650